MLRPLPHILSQVPFQPVPFTIPRYNYKYFFISASSGVCNSPTSTWTINDQSKHNNAETLDSSKQTMSFDSTDDAWLSSMLGVQKVHKNQAVGGHVSEKELEIRNELEMEVERGIEEEIKDGLYTLSLRLHRLYQRQKERNVKEACEVNKNRAVSEVNISIRMEGKSRVEIKESKKEASERGGSRSYRSENAKQVDGLSYTNYDWEKNLRAGSSSVSVNRANRGSKKKDENGTSDPNLGANRKFDNRRGKRNGNGKVDSKLLQLGWRV